MSEERLFVEEQNKFNITLLVDTINSIKECIIITDFDNIVLFVNNAFEEVYGYSREQILGKPISLIRSEKNDPALYNEISEATANGGWSGKLFDKRKNGEDFLVSLNTSVVKNSDDEIIAKVGASLDLSKEIEREISLKTVQDKYRSLFLELKETVYESTPDGKLIDINPSGIELFGYDSKEEILKVDIASDLYANPDERLISKNKLEKDGFVKNHEILIKNKQGEFLTVLETAYAVKDESGNITSFRGILRDITESKRNQELLTQYLKQLATINEQLKASEAELIRSNQEKDKFFSIIAHDLKSPFNSLLGLSEFLVEDIDELSGTEIKTFAEEINIASKNVFKLLENLLQWSQIQTGRLEIHKENFQIKEIVDSALMLLFRNADKKGVNLISNIPEGLLVSADKNMINSVVQNLISNAIKFTSEGDHIYISADRDGDNIIVSVKDTGIGMSDEVVAKIFKIDHHHSTPGTNNEVGTGLGLILCKELIELNDGQITVKSQPQVGTTFKFTLPIVS